MPVSAHSHAHAGCRSHLLQIHEDSRFLTGALAEYIRAGLAAGEAIRVLSTPEHWARSLADLSALGVEPAPALASGQLGHLDAEWALKQVLDEQGRPDLTRFRALVGGARESLRRDWSRVRFYGELVDLLCARGRAADAEILEDYWNAFLAEHLDCLLFCGYSAGNIDPSNLAAVRASHGAELPPVGAELLDDAEAACRRLAGAELRRAADRLSADDEIDRAERLAAVGQLWAGLAHDLNNPLAILVALGGQVRERAARLADPDAREFLRDRTERMEGAAQRMARIVSGVLRLARRENLVSETLSLNQAVSEAVAAVRGSRRLGGVRVEMRGPADAVCAGERGMITQALTNLIENGVDAVAQAGREDGCVEVAWERAGERWRISVRDDGVGMDPATLAKIFTPLFTTKSAGKGSGLGLKLVRQIARAHGGDVNCVSSPGRGSRFEWSVPARIQ